MREIIKSWLKKMEFITGLKQVREMSADDLKMLVDFLEAKAKEYSWMTEDRLNEIMKTGMEGGYGEFYHMNVRTLSVWCNTYHDHHKQKILVEQFPKSADPEPSEEEKEQWLEVGRQIFRDCWQDAKNGHIKDLFFWGPYHYRKFEELGLLKADHYKVDELEIKKQLRLEKGLMFGMSDVAGRKKNIVWKKFIADCISRKIDLPSYL